MKVSRRIKQRTGALALLCLDPRNLPSRDRRGWAQRMNLKDDVARGPAQPAVPVGSWVRLDQDVSAQGLNVGDS